MFKQSMPDSRPDQTHCESTSLYFRDIRKYTPLSREEEVRLLKSMQQGDRNAAHQIITANLRFVIRIAASYIGRGLSLSDLIAEGNMGLIRATETFDPDRDYRFITYAVWWIRQAITTALKKQTGEVVFPANQFEDAGRLNRTANTLTQELGRSPNLAELVERVNMTPKRAIRAMEASQSAIPVEGASFEDECLGSIDALPASDLKPDEVVHQEEIKQLIRDYLKEQPERDAQVISLYFGLDTGDPKSLEKVGEYFGLTRERIRQIRDRALQRLRKQFAQNADVQWEL